MNYTDITITVIAGARSGADAAPAGFHTETNYAPLVNVILTCGDRAGRRPGEGRRWTTWVEGP